MIIEEWVVDELPLRDSLYAYISSTSEENNELINFIDSVKFSSQDFILGVDSSYTIKKSDEIIVMAKLGIDSNNVGFNPLYLKSGSSMHRHLTH